MQLMILSIHHSGGAECLQVSAYDLKRPSSKFNLGQQRAFARQAVDTLPLSVSDFFGPFNGVPRKDHHATVCLQCQCLLVQYFCLVRIMVLQRFADDIARTWLKHFLKDNHIVLMLLNLRNNCFGPAVVSLANARQHLHIPREHFQAVLRMGAQSHYQKAPHQQHTLHHLL